MSFPNYESELKLDGGWRISAKFPRYSTELTRPLSSCSKWNVTVLF